MDKREFPRFDKELAVAYSTDNKPERKSQGTILNISLGGAFMLTDGPLDQGSPLTLTFTVTEKEESVSITAPGSVLRSGKMTDEPAMAAKHSVKSPAETWFAVVKFTAPVIELSFMLQ